MTARVSGPKTAEGANKAGFVFGDPSDVNNKPNTVSDIAEMKAYIVSYADGSGKKQTRIIFRVPNSEVSFILNEKVGGSLIAVSGTPWFNKAVQNKLSAMVPASSIEADSAAQV